MANQIDLTPGANPVSLGGPGIHFHAPNGNSASCTGIIVNPDGTTSISGSNPTDNPAPAKGKQTTVKVTGTPGVVIRFSNPS